MSWRRGYLINWLDRNGRKPIAGRLINLSGQLVLERRLETVPSAHEKRLRVDELSSGLYLCNSSISLS